MAVPLFHSQDYKMIKTIITHLTRRYKEKNDDSNSNIKIETILNIDNVAIAVSSLHPKPIKKITITKG